MRRRRDAGAALGAAVGGDATQVIAAPGAGAFRENDGDAEAAIFAAASCGRQGLCGVAAGACERERWRDIANGKLGRRDWVTEVQIGNCWEQAKQNGDREQLQREANIVEQGGGKYWCVKCFERGKEQ